MPVLPNGRSSEDREGCGPLPPTSRTNEVQFLTLVKSCVMVEIKPQTHQPPPPPQHQLLTAAVISGVAVRPPERVGVPPPR